ncbi:LAFA_0D16050g1_1 [Lachancea sp. 'fantastica']|nr:LAFA_0D16050g1_1 [Lachancea sp. 'fantastica']
MTGGTLGRGKRGRPPLLKEYSDPMQSPMAHSSIQMQKNAASSTFTKPWMRVSPSQKKRRRESTASSNGSYSSAPSISPTQAIARHNRHRGVLLATPVKHQQHWANSSPLTPADNIFSSEPRRQPLRSSPLGPSCGLPDTPSGSVYKNESGSAYASSTHPNKLSQFSFSLCIGNDGKAKIAGASTEATSVDCPKAIDDIAAQKPPLTGFDKSVVLGLLKKMKSSRRESNSPSKVSSIRPSEVFTEYPPQSPKESKISQPTLPWTPNCSAIFQLKTGFTPGNGIDEVLDQTAKHGELQNQRIGRSRSNSAVFKMTSGDPLLMTEEDPSTEFLVSQGHANTSTELFFQQLLSSPKKPSAYFSSPSSFLNDLGSRPQSKQDPQTIRSYYKKPSSECSKNVRGKTIVPTTPVAESSQDYSFSIQCTPLIQQTMSGSLNKFIGETLQQKGHGQATVQSPRALEQDDARLALRNLIGGSN